MYTANQQDRKRLFDFMCISIPEKDHNFNCIEGYINEISCYFEDNKFENQFFYYSLYFVVYSFYSFYFLSREKIKQTVQPLLLVQETSFQK